MIYFNYKFISNIFLLHKIKSFLKLYDNILIQNIFKLYK